MTSPKGASRTASDRRLILERERPHLVLASQSPRRLALLAQAGIVPDQVRAPHLDETPHKKEVPRACAERLAAAKARAAAGRSTDRPSLVLAADTIVAIGRRMLPKAESDQDVCDCLAQLSGRRHQVITTIALLGAGTKARLRTVVTRVAFKRLTSAEIEAYVESREGIGKAGGYAIQGRAETFVRLINGSYSNVVGLPLLETIALLRGGGFPC